MKQNADSALNNNNNNNNNINNNNGNNHTSTTTTTTNSSSSNNIKSNDTRSVGNPVVTFSVKSNNNNDSIGVSDAIYGSQHHTNHRSIFNTGINIVSAPINNNNNNSNNNTGGNSNNNQRVNVPPVSANQSIPLLIPAVRTNNRKIFDDSPENSPRKSIKPPSQVSAKSHSAGNYEKYTTLRKNKLESINKVDEGESSSYKFDDNDHNVDNLFDSLQLSVKPLDLSEAQMPKKSLRRRQSYK